jgi:hypothetical protein
MNRKTGTLTTITTALTLGLAVLSSLSADAQAVTGNWLFDDDFTADIGSDLTATGTWSFQNATIGGESALVASFTAGSYLTVPHGVAPNGGGTKANQYTIIMDVLFPDTPGYVSLYQTDASPTGSDGDWFIRAPNGAGAGNGLGISGDYTDTGNDLRFTDNAWQRIALVIDTTSAAGSDNTVYRSYINGELQNVVQSPDGWGVDGRFSLNPVFYLFADEDGEQSPGLINNLQVRNYAMSAEEVAILNGPTAGGISTAVVPGPGSLMVALMGGMPGVVFLLRRRNQR